MSEQRTIPATDEAWETRQLGAEEEFVKVSENDQLNLDLDTALQLKMISIRLPQSLIDDFKHIASLNNIGYQPLMRQILERFADSEKKRLLAQYSCKVERERKEEAEAASFDEPQRQTG